MPLTPAEFTEPVGAYAPHLWPLTEAEVDVGTTAEQKLGTLLWTWIDQAEAAHPAGDPESPAALRLQRLYLASRADASVYNRLFSAPATASVEGEGSHGFSAAQLAEWKRRAADSLSAYEGAVASLAPPAVVVRLPSRSSSTPTRACWG